VAPSGDYKYIVASIACRNN